MTDRALYVVACTVGLIAAAWIMNAAGTPMSPDLMWGMWGGMAFSAWRMP